MKFKPNANFFAAEAAEFLRKNSRLAVLFACCALLGATIGIAVALKIEDYSSENVIELLKSAEYSKSSAFFKYSALAAVGALIGYLAVFKRVFTLASVFWLIYIGYRFGLLAVGACNVSLGTGLACIFLFCAPIYFSLTALSFAVVGLCSRFWLAKNTAMTCRSLLSRAICETAVCLAVFVAVDAIFTVMIPWLIDILFL